MKNKNLLIIGAIVLILAVYVVGSYNRLVSGNEQIDNQWAQVETQYQRRFDLIPNLVEAVKGVMKQEQSIFTALAEARTRYSGAKTIDEKVGAANQVEDSLSRLLLVVENYPQLKSSENVQTLMAQLEGSENRISVERQRFNDKTRDHNLNVKRFPSNIMASLFGFGERNYFKSASGSEQTPQVKF